MDSANKRKKTNYISGIFCVFLIITCFMVSPIHTPEVWAETKKVSGTVKQRIELARNFIRSTAFKPPIPVGEMETIFGTYSSDDPQWNNATFYSVWFIENLNFIEHAVITHPGGDQIFRTAQGRLKALNVHDWTSDHEGAIIGGTGKFKGIKGRWKEKIVHTQTQVTTEWEAEYVIK
ncbi:MAG: hypothetical protein JRI77_15260 [Deltaproteobacteria bacterium]|nr:hypothetical protein [Deltaproteobacteria bacterium]